jgi:hypothetical protein
MTETTYIRAYCGPRPEPVDACAGRLAKFMESLSEIDPLLASWFETGYSLKSARARKVEPRPRVLRELLLAGQARRDDPARSVMSDLGFRIGLWNGNDTQVGLSTICGAAPSVPGILNAVVVDLPEAEGPALSLYQPRTGLAILKAIIAAWEPSWATWTSDRLRNAQQPKPGQVVVGWATYLASRPPVRGSNLPPEAVVEPFGAGVLITIGDDPASAPESSILAVRDFLTSASV